MVALGVDPDGWDDLGANVKTSRDKNGKVLLKAFVLKLKFDIF